MSGRTVTLVGFMGSGKSTIGGIVARRLRWTFKDTDSLVEDLEGCSIAEIFASKGESYFRDRERRVVFSTPEEGFRVMALGGGGFTEATIPFLKRLGPTIHLDLSFEEVLRRIGKDPRRPLSLDPNLFGLFIRRRKLYGRASHRVWTEGLTKDEVAEAVLRLV